MIAFGFGEIIGGTAIGSLVDKFGAKKKYFL
jgi:hypothetical protein